VSHDKAKIVAPLYVFIDESGNFDFTSNGTKHFVMAAVATMVPTTSASTLHDLRYKLLVQGIDISQFHAAPDSIEVRKRAFSEISQVPHLKLFVAYGKKSNFPKAVKSDELMHAAFCKELIKIVLKDFDSKSHSHLVLILDQALTRTKQEWVHTQLKPILKSLKKPYFVYFQQMRVDMNGQIADYVAWAKFRQLERDDHGYWNLLSKTLRPTEFEVVRDLPNESDFQ